MGSIDHFWPSAELQVTTAIAAPSEVLLPGQIVAVILADGVTS